ncbi:MAG: TonB C-terminal domain-containing protein [Cyanobacteria bacterium SZAS LIN-3]|nr:TonB C-terminal domain-containing protein [Cyanobacteria bacterium SZAS LIN-3]
MISLTISSIIQLLLVEGLHFMARASLTQKLFFAVSLSTITNFVVGMPFCLAAQDRALSLDATNAARSDGPALGPYMKGLRQLIESRWNPFGTPGTSEAIISFIITERGELLNPHVISSSGNPDFDQAAINAISACTPFSPLPPVKAGAVMVRAEFNGRLLPRPTATYQPQPQFPPNNPGLNYQQSPQYQSQSTGNLYQQSSAPYPSQAYQMPTQQMPYRGADPVTSDQGDQAMPAALNSSAPFLPIPLIKLKYYSDDQISSYLIRLDSWLKLDPAVNP